MDKKEIEVGGNTYLIGTIDARKQFHVARRIAPVLIALSSSLEGVASLDTMEKMMSKAAEVVSKMPEDDVDYVLNACLTVARRKSGDSWARVMTGTNLQFADMGMDEMLRITVETIKENLGGFFLTVAGGQQ